MFDRITRRKRAFIAAGIAVAVAGALGGIALAGSSDAPPPADPIPARMLGSDVPVPISPAILRTTNGWVTSNGRTLVAVYAGAAGDGSGTGRLVIVRQNLDSGSQTVDSVDLGNTGAVSIVNAPLGSAVETSAQKGKLRFSGSQGSTGSIDLGNNDAVSVNAP
jgi:hypothetical protein